MQIVVLRPILEEILKIAQKNRDPAHLSALARQIAPRTRADRCFPHLAARLFPSAGNPRRTLSRKNRTATIIQNTYNASIIQNTEMVE